MKNKKAFTTILCNCFLHDNVKLQLYNQSYKLLNFLFNTKYYTLYVKTHSLTYFKVEMHRVRTVRFCLDVYLRKLHT